MLTNNPNFDEWFEYCLLLEDEDFLIELQFISVTLMKGKNGIN
jgi:hypothetical protein